MCVCGVCVCMCMYVCMYVHVYINTHTNTDKHRRSCCLSRIIILLRGKQMFGKGLGLLVSFVWKRVGEGAFQLLVHQS